MGRTKDGDIKEVSLSTSSWYSYSLNIQNHTSYAKKVFQYRHTCEKILSTCLFTFVSFRVFAAAVCLSCLHYHRRDRDFLPTSSIFAPCTFFAHVQFSTADFQRIHRLHKLRHSTLIAGVFDGFTDLVSCCSFGHSRLITGHWIKSTAFLQARKPRNRAMSVSKLHSVCPNFPFFRRSVWSQWWLYGNRFCSESMILYRK